MTRPQQWLPNTIGRNTDPVLISYLFWLGVQKRGEEYLSFPQRALFEKIGIRTIYAVREITEAGGLISYGASISDAYGFAGTRASTAA